MKNVYVVVNGEHTDGYNVSIELFKVREEAKKRKEELATEIGDDDEYFVYMTEMEVI